MQPGRRAAATAVALAAGGLVGCGTLWRPSPMAMDVIWDDRACPATQAPVLLVLLPGAYMTPAEMQREGMVGAVRSRGLAVDVAIADAHMGYVIDGSLLQRLHADVIAPARAQGWRRIWLAGISLGGYVALGYAQQHPGALEGIVALAPYLGRRGLVQAVAAAGGPAAWRRTAQPRDAADHDHALWMWLSARPADAPSLYLGYGAEDRFAQGHAMLAGLLPPADVGTAPGGHDWPPWRSLWSQWLDRELLPRQCAA